MGNPGLGCPHAHTLPALGLVVSTVEAWARADGFLPLLKLSVLGHLLSLRVQKWGSY